MSDNSLHLELFDEANKRFAKHLGIPNNERIIFSGKFGHGKTTFLREFFKEENQKKNFRIENKTYNIISLFPVNYSVASNEDIFRYIKYDIIYEMLYQDYIVEQYTEEYIDGLPEFLKQNIDKVFAALIYMIPKVGREVVDSYDRVKKLLDEYDSYHKGRKDSLNEGEQLIGYVEHLEKTEGSIFEDDAITRLIETVIRKNKQEGQETILIIDDLDRIDPEHIFRILNVFAAHFDRRDITKTKNKFGFDKVIVVCDIENIRQIFSHKYGISTDFNGYIDKFYSPPCWRERVGLAIVRQHACAFTIHADINRGQTFQ